MVVRSQGTTPVIRHQRCRERQPHPAGLRVPQTGPSGSFLRGDLHLPAGPPGGRDALAQDAHRQSHRGRQRGVSLHQPLQQHQEQDTLDSESDYYRIFKF